MTHRWRVKYDYQMAGWIVYRGSRMLRDYFPTEDSAVKEATNLNNSEEDE